MGLRSVLESSAKTVVLTLITGWVLKTLRRRPSSRRLVEAMGKVQEADMSKFVHVAKVRLPAFSRYS